MGLTFVASHTSLGEPAGFFVLLLSCCCTFVYGIHRQFRPGFEMRDGRCSYMTLAMPALRERSSAAGLITFASLCSHARDGLLLFSQYLPRTQLCTLS